MPVLRASFLGASTVRALRRAWLGSAPRLRGLRKRHLIEERVRRSAARTLQRAWSRHRRRCAALACLQQRLPWLGRRCPVQMTPLPLQRRRCFAHIVSCSRTVWYARAALQACVEGGVADAMCGTALLPAELRRLGTDRGPSTRPPSSIVTYFRRTLREHVRGVWAAGAGAPEPLQVYFAAQALQHTHMGDIAYAATQLRGALGEEHWRDECACIEDGAHSVGPACRSHLTRMLYSIVR